MSLESMKVDLSVQNAIVTGASQGLGRSMALALAGAGARVALVARNAEKLAETARLIEEAGLKGFTIGGAKISEKHANFIVNTGRATATDILNLAQLVQQEVFKRFGIKLEPEVHILGGK